MSMLPRKLAHEGLGELMRDPRYFDGYHREHLDYVDFMRASFEATFGDDSGNNMVMKRTKEGADTSKVTARQSGKADQMHQLDPARRRAAAALLILGAVEAAGRRGIGNRNHGESMRLPVIPYGVKASLKNMLESGKRTVSEALLPQPPNQESAIHEAARMRGKSQMSQAKRQKNPTRARFGIPGSDIQLSTGVRFSGAGGRGAPFRVK